MIRNIKLGLTGKALAGFCQPSPFGNVITAASNKILETLVNHKQWSTSHTAKQERFSKMTLSWKKVVVGLGFLAVVGVAYILLWQADLLATIVNAEDLQKYVKELGPIGPIAIVGLLALAIVFTPLPSAPIALAAGAAYGHYWGTLYVVIGAETGALLAFMIARFLGYDTLHKWLGDKLSIGLLGSQNALMGIVFVSRLLPFVSFDLVSYAAGLTHLSAWRFALATLAGIVPASFLLAHFGEEIASNDTQRILISVLALGLLTGIPFALKAILARRTKGVRTTDRN